jgi:hypothetical protein
MHKLYVGLLLKDTGFFLLMRIFTTAAAWETT